MLLTRKDNKVYHNNVELTIVSQSTKGPGKEVVKIDGLPGSNGQKWISLSKLKDGDNEVVTKSTDRTTSSYSLTKEEQEQVDNLKKQIEVIINNAKSRFVPKSKSITSMNLEEIQKYLDNKRLEEENIKNNLKKDTKKKSN